MSAERPERITDLLGRKFPPNPSWIEPKILPKGGTLILGGEAKVGKSFQMLDYARAVATGTNLFQHPELYAPVPAKVLLLEQEVGPETLQNRCQGAFKRENPNVYKDTMWYKSRSPDLLLNTILGKRLLYDFVSEVRPNVLILDPIGQMYLADENAADEVGKMFNFLDRLKSDFSSDGLSIIIAHHFKKPPADTRNYDFLDQNNFRGTGRWSGNPDTIQTAHRFEEIAGVNYTAWKDRVRFTLRHGSGPKDFVVSIQRDNDHRVLYEPPKASPPKLTRDTAVRPDKDSNTPSPEQKLFILV